MHFPKPSDHHTSHTLTFHYVCISHAARTVDPLEFSTIVFPPRFRSEHSTGSRFSKHHAHTKTHLVSHLNSPKHHHHHRIAVGPAGCITRERIGDAHAHAFALALTDDRTMIVGERIKQTRTKKEGLRFFRGATKGE